MAQSPFDIIIGKARKIASQGAQKAATAFRDDSSLGVAKNTVTGLPRAGAKTVLDVAKGLAKGGATFAVSAGEAIPRLVIPNASTKVSAPTRLPGVLGKLGEIESYQSQANRNISQGKSAPLEVAKVFGKAAIDEPLGVALKPIAVVGSIGAKMFLKEGSELGAKKALTSGEQYVQELLAKRKTAGEVPANGAKAKAIDLYQNIKSKLIDSNAPIEDAIADAKKKHNFSLLPEADITNQIDRTLRAPTLAGQFARDNGLEEVIKNVDDLDNLDQYLIAKHAMDVEKRGIATGRNAVRDQELLREFGEKYEAPAKAVNEYSRKLLDYSVDAGLIDAKLAENLKNQYPNYVPLQRVFNELERTGNFNGTGGGVASLSKQSVVQKLKGSTREIESPIESLLTKTNDAFVQGEKNKSARILAGYRNVPGMSDLIKELPTGESAPHTFSYLDNGVKRTFETTPEISNAAKRLNVQQLNILGQILALPVRVAKLGITGINVPFVLSNVVRDQIFSFVTSKNGIKTSVANPSVFLQSLFSAVKHDELYRDLVRAGAGGTTFDISRNQVSKTVEGIRANRSVASKIKYIATNPSELLRHAEDIIGRSEEVTRLQQFKGTRDALIAEGRSVEEATTDAAKAARENTANFYRKGEWGTVLNSALLYINAGIQGSRAFVRALERNPKQTIAKTASAILFPVSAVTAWNLSDPVRKEAYADIPEYEKQNNIIIIPPNPIKDEKGKWNIIKIPLPPGVGNLATPVRRGLEASQGLDPVKFGEIASALVGSVSPIEPNKGSIFSTLTPQALKPSIEARVNRNLFTGFQQVPSYLEDLSPELQVKDTTSGTAEKIGNALGQSPIKTEEFIEGTFGSIGSQALNASDNVLAKVGLIPENKIGGTSIKEGVLSRFFKARGGANDQREVDVLNDSIRQQDDLSAKRRKNAEAIYAELKKLPKEEANARALEIKKTDPLLYEKIKDVKEEVDLDLSYKERRIKQLGVENKERAKYIWGEVNKLKTREEKNAYIANLKAKKVISENVWKQLQEIKSSNQ